MLELHNEDFIENDLFVDDEDDDVVSIFEKTQLTKDQIDFIKNECRK